MQHHEEWVADLARTFLDRIDPELGDWGALAGRWHDLGKYHPDFQSKLHGKRIQIEHAGAVLAMKSLPQVIAQAMVGNAAFA